jgi:hypothetical protein
MLPGREVEGITDYVSATQEQPLGRNDDASANDAVLVGGMADLH